jgi:hypothetical protein
MLGVDMSPEEIDNVIDLMAKTKAVLPNVRLFLISETKMLRIYRGSHNIGWSRNNFGLFLPNKFDRGEVLDCFAKLEFLINEMIQLHVLGYASGKSYCMDDLLENIDLFSRIRLLNGWDKIITNKLMDLIMKLKEVRNGLAHKWDERDVTYKKIPLSVLTNFKIFRADFENAWTQLIAAYRTQLLKIDIKTIMLLINSPTET